MSANGSILSIRGLEVGMRKRGGSDPIVRGIDLDVAAGEKVGIVGESGSGKSLTMLSVLRLLPAQLDVLGGSIGFAGEDLATAPGERLRAIRGGEVAMVYQDPMTSLNPLLRIGHQIVETLKAHGVGAEQARARALEVLDAVGLPDPSRVIDAFPHELSGGMLQRVMIAMALAPSPRMLIADEPTTALDVTIQQQIIDLVNRLQADTGMSVVWITHDLGVIAQLADRVAVMYAGRIVEQASTRQVFTRPSHPYTAALLGSLPTASSTHREPLQQIGGTPPDPARLGAGCPFRPRCPFAVERCEGEEPPLLERGTGQVAACWREPATWKK